MILHKKPAYLFILQLFLFFSQIIYSQSASTTKTDSSSQLFNDGATDSDYLVAIEKAGEVLETAYNDTEFKGNTYHLFDEITRTQSKLNQILISLKEANPNVRNQQMYHIVLQEIKLELEEQNVAINSSNKNLEKIKAGFVNLRNDKNLMSLIKDTIRRKQFKKEFSNLKKRYLATDSIMSSNQGILNNKKKLTVENKIIVSNALITVERKLEKTGASIFGKEYSFLWYATSTNPKKANLNIKGKIAVEQSVAAYYLTYSVGKLIVLFLLIVVLAWYIYRNIKYLSENGHFENLSQLNFKYLNKGILIPVLIIGFNIAIVSNIYAPALYIEIFQLILLGILTLSFKNSWPKVAIRNWLLLLTLFVALCFLDLFIEIGLLQRCIFIGINILGIRYGLIQIKAIENQLSIKGFFKVARYIFICLNALAILFNILGRVSLSNMLSLTAVITLTQIIALSIMLKIILEIILLQIYSTRIKRGLEKIFDHETLSDTLKKPFVLVIGYMWIVVIASNLNIWEILRSSLASLLTYIISIGSISFTLGNVVLFFIIIWIAHLLQKYVAYFFGEVDHDQEEDINKGQHSKLLITRLVVLILGYLLAVTASGMPLDKLGILLGALGVGVGLGLQNIVNNFVSGIILIFDKPIQIGDVIDISSQSGRVKSMGLRTTKINASNGAEIIIPNGNLLSQNITNWTYTDNFKLVEISFVVIGTISPDDVNAIVIKALEGIPSIVDTRTPQIYYSALSDGKYTLLVKFWCSIYKTEETISSARQTLFTHFTARDLTFTS